MNAYVLSRANLNDSGHTVEGGYTTLALAEAARDEKINAFVAAENAQRDLDYAAGIACDAVLTYEIVLPLATITTVVVDA